MSKHRFKMEKFSHPITGEVWVVLRENKFLAIFIGQSARKKAHEVYPDLRCEEHSTQASREICEYLDGMRKKISVAPDWKTIKKEMTPFQYTVLKKCFAIPWGKVRTYAELAALSGSPLASRAVGQVMHKNPVPIVIPCHRVVASTGLGGFAPGVEMKTALLGLEGCAPSG